jgi:hypothetical protein
VYKGDDVTSDDDRIAYLSGGVSGGELAGSDRDDLDDLRALLADPSVWEEPSADLEDAVVAAVQREATAGRPSVPTRRVVAGRRRLVAVLAAAAAVAAVLLAVTLVGGQGTDRAQFAASLRPTDLARGASGDATFTKQVSGWRIELDGDGLPRLDGGRFYQAWLRNEDGDLVAIGSFNEPRHVVLWAGVSPRDFRTLTVTEEAADNDQASSRRQVLVGSIAER